MLFRDEFSKKIKGVNDRVASTHLNSKGIMFCCSNNQIFKYNSTVMLQNNNKSFYSYTTTKMITKVHCRVYINFILQKITSGQVNFLIGLS